MTPDDLTFPQPPTMTREHAHAIRLMVTLWPYPTAVPHYLIAEVAEHLGALIAQPVPSRGDPAVVLALVDKWIADPEPDPEPTPIEPLRIRSTSHHPSDWGEVYTPPTMSDCYDCDQ